MVSCLVMPHERLLRELRVVTRQQDAVLVLAKRLHQQMLGGRVTFGILSLSGDVGDL